MNALRNTSNIYWKKIVTAAVCCEFVFAFALCADDRLQVADLDPVTIEKAPVHKPVVLVHDGQPKAVIHVMNGGGTIDKLAKELQDAITATTGAKLPLVREAPAADQPAIVIAQSTDLPFEGYAVKTGPNRVFISGNGEGAAWGIVDFLERIVDVRWYWPLDHHGRTIEKKADLVIEPMSYHDAPAYRMRVGWPPFYNGTPYGTLRVKDLYDRLRGGNSWPTQLRVHQPSQWKGVYAEDRPEIFALRDDGTRSHAMYCYGNPRTLETFLENIALYKSLDESERRKGENRQKLSFINDNAISVSPPDMGVYCACSDCQALLDMDKGQYETASRLMGTFVKRLAEEVAKRWPDMTVIYLPYVNYTFAPKGIDFPDNVEVQLCGMPGIAMYKEPDLNARYQKNIDDWAALTGGKVQTWDYACWPTDRTKAPFQYPHVLKDYYQRNTDKLIGTFINGGIPDEWLAQHFTMYCWMKLMWDPQFDVDAAADEFCRRMFGKAAKPVRELLRLQTDRWEQIQWPVDKVSPKALYEMTYPPEILERMKALLADAQNLVANDEVTAARVAYYAAPFAGFFEEADSMLSGEGMTHLIAQKVPANPIIDGKLDDRWWGMAEPVTFVRKAGTETIPAKYETQVRAVWTLDGVTFGLRMAEPNPATLKMDLKTRDEGSLWPANDNAEIFIDVTGNKEGKYHQWLITPAGTILDVRDDDITWNSDEAKSAAYIGDDYWSVELYVPIAMFENVVKPATGAVWAGQFTRHRISDARDDRKDDSTAEYSRMNNKLGGFSRNAADFGLIKFVE